MYLYCSSCLVCPFARRVRSLVWFASLIWTGGREAGETTGGGEGDGGGEGRGGEGGERASERERPASLCLPACLHPACMAFSCGRSRPESPRAAAPSKKPPTVCRHGASHCRFEWQTLHRLARCGGAAPPPANQRRRARGHRGRRAQPTQWRARLSFHRPRGLAQPAAQRALRPWTDPGPVVPQQVPPPQSPVPSPQCPHPPAAAAVCPPPRDQQKPSALFALAFSALLFSPLPLLSRLSQSHLHLRPKPLSSPRRRRPALKKVRLPAPPPRWRSCPSVSPLVAVAVTARRLCCGPPMLTCARKARLLHQNHCRRCKRSTRTRYLARSPADDKRRLHRLPPR